MPILADVPSPVRSDVIRAARFVARTGRDGSPGDPLPISTTDPALAWIADHLAEFRVLVARALGPVPDLLGGPAPARLGVRVRIDLESVLWSQLLRALDASGVLVIAEEGRGYVVADLPTPPGEDPRHWSREAVPNLRTARVEVEPLE